MTYHRPDSVMGLPPEDQAEFYNQASRLVTAWLALTLLAAAIVVAVLVYVYALPVEVQ